MTRILRPFLIVGAIFAIAFFVLKTKKSQQCSEGSALGSFDTWPDVPVKE